MAEIDMNTVFGLNFFVFCIAGLFLIMYFTKELRDEGFFTEEKTVSKEVVGAKPKDAMGSIHIPPKTGEGVVMLKRNPEMELIQSNLVRRDIQSMTEGDMQREEHAPA